MTDEHKRRLDAWRERIRAVVRPYATVTDGYSPRLADAEDAAMMLDAARRMKLSERAYSATMADLCRRYNHPAVFGRLVLDTAWAMVAAEQNGNVID